jgi:hypothetical protein
MYNINYGWLTYGNERFQWKYKEIIEIRLCHRKHNIVLIEFDRQSLLNLINKRLQNDSNQEISHIPPEFLSKAIKKAIANNWNPKEDIAEMMLYLHSNEFTVKQKKI